MSDDEAGMRQSQNEGKYCSLSEGTLCEHVTVHHHVAKSPHRDTYEAIDSPFKYRSLQTSRNSAPFSAKFWKVCSKVRFSSDITGQQSYFLWFPVRHQGQHFGVSFLIFYLWLLSSILGTNCWVLCEILFILAYMSCQMSIKSFIYSSNFLGWISARAYYSLILVGIIFKIVIVVACAPSFQLFSHSRMSLVLSGWGPTSSSRRQQNIIRLGDVSLSLTSTLIVMRRWGR